mgnify:CR=1 FL=1
MMFRLKNSVALQLPQQPLLLLQPLPLLQQSLQLPQALRVLLL